jgi:hypothetical protein
MTPKEKATELVTKIWLKIPAAYDPTNTLHIPIAKEIALIVVDEILEDYGDVDQGGQDFPYDYWNSVKTEIEKL